MIGRALTQMLEAHAVGVSTTDQAVRGLLRGMLPRGNISAKLDDAVRSDQDSSTGGTVGILE